MQRIGLSYLFDLPMFIFQSQLMHILILSCCYSVNSELITPLSYYSLARTKCDSLNHLNYKTLIEVHLSSQIVGSFMVEAKLTIWMVLWKSFYIIKISVLHQGVMNLSFSWRNFDDIFAFPQISLLIDQYLLQLHLPGLQT